ncbi:MAG: SpoIID/LytB domain-containing protein [Elusimicrobiota bacterium]
MPTLRKNRRKKHRSFFKAAVLPALAAAALLTFPGAMPWAARALRPKSTFMPATNPSTRKIRIGVVMDARRLNLGCQGRCEFHDLSGKLYYLVPGKNYRVRARERNMTLGPLPLSPRTPIDLLRMSDCALVNGRCYRGMLVLRRNSGDTVTAIDILDIEDYLLGVLPNEMDPAWPLEALKAQAVVARTFAYTQLDKYARQGYDLSDDTRSQVFGGLSRVSPAVQKAVNQTAGEVLGYKGKILDVYYHACCGGHTANEADVWGGPQPPRPLRGVRDPYCRRSPFYKWRVGVPLAKVLSALEPAALIAGPLESFRIGKKDWNGYVQSFIGVVNGDRLPISASKFRRRIGNSFLKSARIYKVKLRSNRVEFYGHGLGHGVGLCQWGAKAQAQDGRGYERILKFYFPGAYLAVVDE